MEFELAQKSVKVKNKDYYSNNKMKELCRRLVSEGIVLLKNNDVLPLLNKKFALFGRCQINSFYVGYGSGGDVNFPYRVSILEGLINNGALLDEIVCKKYESWCKLNNPEDIFYEWGKWPTNYSELRLEEEFIYSASLRNDIAVIIIGRASGEDRELQAIDGSWYLTDIERELLSLTRKYFKKTCVVINSGSIIDTKEILSYNPDGLMYVWHGGQETGNGIADVLIGKVSPSGKLVDTIAVLEDYPAFSYFGGKENNYYKEDIYVGYRYFNTFAEDKIIYPFGYGLSYTEFETKGFIIRKNDTIFNVSIEVKNVGKYCGKEVVQVYLSAPLGLLGKPALELVYYYKTKDIMPFDTEVINFDLDLKNNSSFDDIGITGYINSFVLEKGKYKIFIGNSSANLDELYTFELTETILVEKCN